MQDTPEYKLSRAGKTAFERLEASDLSDFTEDQISLLIAFMKMAYSDGVEVGVGIGRTEASDYYQAVHDCLTSHRLPS